jgi:GAF domain-containing protein
MRSFAGLALRTRNRQRPLGVIYLDYQQVKDFSTTDCELFASFARQAGLLLQEVWLEHHLEEVARIGQKINHNLATVEDLFQQLQTYVDTVLDESHTLVLGIYQPQAYELDLYIRAHRHLSRLSLSLQGAYQQVIETQRALFIEQVSREPEEIQTSIRETNAGGGRTESALIAPLTLRDASVGILSIQHQRPRAYGEHDLFVLQLLANYTSLALHNVRLYSNMIQLSETGQVLTQRLESEHTLQATVAKIQEATHADLVVLFPYDSVLRRFLLPPRVAGTLLDPTFPRATILHPNDIAVLALERKEPIFARDSNTSYAELRVGYQELPGNFKDREKIHSAAVVPLRVEDVPVGVLFVNFRQAQRFDAIQKRLIEGLAHYAAIAIKNSQVFGTLSLRRVRELEALQRIDRELSQALDLNSVLHTILRLACERVPADSASILLLNNRMQLLETAAAIGLDAETSQKPKLLFQDARGITLWAMKEKKPILVRNVHTDPLWRDRYLLVIDRTQAELDVPLLDGNEVIGVLNVESTKEGAFQQEDQDILLTLAGQAVLAIKNGRAYEREKRLAEEGRVLNQISKEITGQLEPEHVFDLIVEKALALTDSTRGNLMIYDADHHDLWMAAVRGDTREQKGSRHSIEEGIVGRVAKARRMLNVDLTQSPWQDVYLDFFPGTLSELAVPLQVGDELYGVLNVESQASQNYTERDERLLQGLADLAVIVVQNADAFKREQRLVEEGQVLNEISRQITSQLDSTHVFHLILTKALEFTRSTLGSLHLYNARTQQLTMVAWQGTGEQRELCQSVGVGVVGQAAARLCLLNIPDMTPAGWEDSPVSLSRLTRSALAAPMLAGDELRGVLNVENAGPHHFKDADERLLQGLADLAVVALQNTERYKEAQRDAQRFKLLYQAGQELGKITDVLQLELAYDSVLRIAEEQSQSLVLLRRYDKDAQVLELVRASQPEYAALSRRTPLHIGTNGQVARERRTIVIHDVDRPPPDLAMPRPSNSTTRSLLITPILFENQYYGNLSLNHAEVGHFQDADILFFEGLAQQLASTIHRLETVQARKEVEQRAMESEQMSSFGQYVFEVTHRLGNDLGVVGPYISDIQTELEHLSQHNPYIAKKLENIRQTVRSVLSFSATLKQRFAQLTEKEEIGKERIRLSPKRLLTEAAAEVPAQPTLRVSLDISEDAAQVYVFHELVADILRNLLTNAVQALSDGGTITLRAYNEGRYVALQVSDTGTGIAPEDLPKIFELFFSKKKARGGTGFGLWSARRNARRNRGDLKVESHINRGTTFTLLLPRAGQDGGYESL